MKGATGQPGLQCRDCGGRRGPAPHGARSTTNDRKQRMQSMKHKSSMLAVAICLCGHMFAADTPSPLAPGQWTPEKAWAWYLQQPWLVGCNFLPSTAVNDVEMWQKESFDPQTIDRELGWSQVEPRPISPGVPPKARRSRRCGTTTSCVPTALLSTRAKSSSSNRPLAASLPPICRQPKSWGPPRRMPPSPGATRRPLELTGKRRHLPVRLVSLDLAFRSSSICFTSLDGRA